MFSRSRLAKALVFLSVATTSGALGVRIASAAPSATASSLPPRIVKGPWVQRVTSASAIVRVEVEPPGPVTFELGIGMPEGDAGHHGIESPDAKTLHAITVPDLQPSTRYAYSVRAGTVSKVAAFTTAPPDDSDAPFRFIAYGDTRTDDTAHAAVVRAMVPSLSDFIVHTGDFVEDGASLAQWQNFFEIEAPLLRARCLVSAVGNHELTDGSGIAYARFLGPTDAVTGLPNAQKPEHLDGTFRWGNTRFFLLNGIESFKNGTTQRSWLERMLGAADTEAGLRWRVVVVHHGLWSSGPHGGNQAMHDAGVPALLKAHNVDLMLSGHDHVYERGEGNGLPFLVTGGGGAPLYRLRRTIPQSKRAESVHHFVEIAVSPSTLRTAAIRADGTTIERCALVKGAPGWDCDPSTGAGEDGGAWLLPPSPYGSDASPAKPTSRCACDAPGAPAAGGASLLATALSLGVAAVRRRRRGLAT